MVITKIKSEDKVLDSAKSNGYNWRKRRNRRHERYTTIEISITKLLELGVVVDYTLNGSGGRPNNIEVRRIADYAKSS